MIFNRASLLTLALVLGGAVLLAVLNLAHGADPRRCMCRPMSWR